MRDSRSHRRWCRATQERVSQAACMCCKNILTVYCLAYTLNILNRRRRRRFDGVRSEEAKLVRRGIRAPALSDTLTTRGQILNTVRAAAQALCYLDVGGTFTDAFVVDDNGDFLIGKAPTTPEDISRGLFAAIEAALDAGGLDRKKSFEELKVIGYGATTVLNGIDTGALAASVAALAQNPALAPVAFSAKTTWNGRLRSETRIEGYELGGSRIIRSHAVRTDEPRWHGRSPVAQRGGEGALSFSQRLHDAAEPVPAQRKARSRPAPPPPSAPASPAHRHPTL